MSYLEYLEMLKQAALQRAFEEEMLKQAALQRAYEESLVNELVQAELMKQASYDPFMNFYKQADYELEDLTNAIGSTIGDYSDDIVQAILGANDAVFSPETSASTYGLAGAGIGGLLGAGGMGLYNYLTNQDIVPGLIEGGLGGAALGGTTGAMFGHEFDSEVNDLATTLGLGAGATLGGVGIYELVQYLRKNPDALRNLWEKVKGMGPEAKKMFRSLLNMVKKAR